MSKEPDNYAKLYHNNKAEAKGCIELLKKVCNNYYCTYPISFPKIEKKSCSVYVKEIDHGPPLFFFLGLCVIILWFMWAKGWPPVTTS